MHPVHRILVPTDFSEPSNDAVRAAIELADHFAAEVHLLHIVAPQAYYADIPEAMLPPVEDFTREMMDSAKQKLDAICQNSPPEIQTTAHVEESADTAAHAICDFAAKLPADLIVIGSHGNTGLMHVLIGATAEHVVRFARCPVLVTKQETKEES
ncbi:MAG: universal stress protein [Mariprofundaceae bacterium]